MSSILNKTRFSQIGLSALLLIASTGAMAQTAGGADNRGAAAPQQNPPRRRAGPRSTSRLKRLRRRSKPARPATRRSR